MLLIYDNAQSPCQFFDLFAYFIIPLHIIFIIITGVFHILIYQNIRNQHI